MLELTWIHFHFLLTGITGNVLIAPALNLKVWMNESVKTTLTHKNKALHAKLVQRPEWELHRTLQSTQKAI